MCLCCKAVRLVGWSYHVARKLPWPPHSWALFLNLAGFSCSQGLTLLEWDHEAVTVERLVLNLKFYAFSVLCKLRSLLEFSALERVEEFASSTRKVRRVGFPCLWEGSSIAHLFISHSEPHIDPIQLKNKYFYSFVDLICSFPLFFLWGTCCLISAPNASCASAFTSIQANFRCSQAIFVMREIALAGQISLCICETAVYAANMAWWYRFWSLTA